MKHKQNPYLVGMLLLKKDKNLIPPIIKTVFVNDEIQNYSHNYDPIMEQELTAGIASNIINDSKVVIDDWVLVKYNNLILVRIIKYLSE